MRSAKAGDYSSTGTRTCIRSFTSLPRIRASASLVGSQSPSPESRLQLNRSVRATELRAVPARCAPGLDLDSDALCRLALERGGGVSLDRLDPLRVAHGQPLGERRD